MKKAKKMKVLALLLAVCVVLMLTGCEVSSSTTSTTTVTTSKTDADGNTTTNTTTTEVGATVGTNGVSTTAQTNTETTTTPAGEAPSFTAEDLRSAWQERYVGGGKGTDKGGDTIYFAYDDPDQITQAVMMLVSADGKNLLCREGEVFWDDENECEVLYDEETDSSISFVIDEGDGEDTYIIRFIGDGDEAVMKVMDLDSLFDEMIAVWNDFVSSEAA